MKTPLLLRILAAVGLVFCGAACSSFVTTNGTSEAALSPNGPGSAFGVDAGPGAGATSGAGFNPGSNGGGSGVGATSGH